MAQSEAGRGRSRRGPGLGDTTCSFDCRCFLLTRNPPAALANVQVQANRSLHGDLTEGEGGERGRGFGFRRGEGRGLGFRWLRGSFKQALLPWAEWVRVPWTPRNSAPRPEARNPETHTQPMFCDVTPRLEHTGETMLRLFCALCIPVLRYLCTCVRVCAVWLCGCVLCGCVAVLFSGGYHCYGSAGRS